jgi:hypothetical protein
MIYRLYSLFCTIVVDFPLFTFLVARPVARHRGCATNFLVPAGLGTNLDGGNILRRS